MRAVFWMAFVANVAVTSVSLAVLPARVAIHFGVDGMADNWASKAASALLMTGVHLLLLGLLCFSTRLAWRLPPRWINLPHKEYWLRPENLPRARTLVEQHMWRIGTATFLFFLAVGLLSLQANLSDPVRLNLRLFLPALGLFLAYTAWWTVGFLRAFRLPRQP
ncbi:MAG: DUF1648 domain-containing protein [Lentisphaeria bacterium]|nr:DUF1648 domain-containing protein [Lentisphaeria bacterium]